MKVLVTGSKGFIGKNLLVYLYIKLFRIDELQRKEDFLIVFLLTITFLY